MSVQLEVVGWQDLMVVVEVELILERVEVLMMVVVVVVVVEEVVVVVEVLELELVVDLELELELLVVEGVVQGQGQLEPEWGQGLLFEEDLVLVNHQREGEREAVLLDSVNDLEIV